jgi:hypothetical protein
VKKLFATILLLWPMTALADSAALKVDHAWSRVAMAGHEGVVYLTITNPGPADTLTGITTPVAAMADLHETINANGVMKMRPVKSLTVGQGKSVSLAPGGFHIMLSNLKQPLKEGESISVTLTFSKAGNITTNAMVEKAGATGVSGMSMPSGGTQP